MDNLNFSCTYFTHVESLPSEMRNFLKVFVLCYAKYLLFQSEIHFGCHIWNPGKNLNSLFSILLKEIFICHGMLVSWRKIKVILRRRQVKNPAGGKMASINNHRKSYDKMLCHWTQKGGGRVVGFSCACLSEMPRKSIPPRL